MNTTTLASETRANGVAPLDLGYLAALILPVLLLLQRQSWVLPHTGLGVGMGTLCALTLAGITVIRYANGTQPSVFGLGPVPVLLLVWLTTLLCSYLSWAMSGFRAAALMGDLGLIQFVIETIFVLGLTAVLAQRERVWTFIKVLTACGGVYGLILIVTSAFGTEVAEMLRFPLLQVQDPLAGVEASRGGFIRSQGMAGHPLEAGAVAAALTPVGIGLCRGLAARGLRWRPWGLLVAAELLGAMSTLSRSATVAVAAALAVMALRWPLKTIAQVCALAGALALVAALVVPDRLGTYLGLFATDSRTDSSLYSRAQARDYVFQVLRHRFWTGEGMGTQTALGRPVLDNQYLGFAVEIGVPATIAFCLMIVVSVLFLLQRSATLPAGRGELALGVAGGLAAMGVVLAVLDAFAFPQVRLVTYVLFALVGAVLVRSRPAPKARSAKYTGRHHTPRTLTASRLSRLPTR